MDQSLNINRVVNPDYVFALVVYLFAGPEEGEGNYIAMIVTQCEYLVTRDPFLVVVDAAEGYDA